MAEFMCGDFPNDAVISKVAARVGIEGDVPGDGPYESCAINHLCLVGVPVHPSER